MDLIDSKNEAEPSLQRYTCTKSVDAKNMCKYIFEQDIKGNTSFSSLDDEEGYLVVYKSEGKGTGNTRCYPDNYVSWSPKKTFEEGYIKSFIR